MRCVNHANFVNFVNCIAYICFACYVKIHLMDWVKYMSCVEFGELCSANLLGFCEFN